MGIGNIVIGSSKDDSGFAQAFCNVHTLRYGLESGPVRRASTGVSPLLSLWLPSPEVAVKSPAVRRKSVHQSHRVATIFVVTFVNREGDTPAPPHRHATRMPHASNALPEARRGQAIGLCSVPHVSSECHPASGPQPAAKVRLEPPNLESRAEEVVVEDAEPYHENPPLAPPVPPSTLPLRPNVPPVVLDSSLPRAVLPIPLSSQDTPRRSSLSEMCRPCGGCRQRNVVSPSFRSTRMGKHGSSR